MKDFFSFKKMITPVIIKILFWLAILGCIIGGIFQIAMGATMGATMEFGFMPELVLTGFALLIFGPIVVRVYCELLLILFSMNDTLTEIKQQLARQQGQSDQSDS